MPAEARLVADLQAAWIALSTLVRVAIGAVSARYGRRPQRRRPREALAAIYRDIPEPTGFRDWPRKQPKRRELQRLIRDRLRKRKFR